MFHHKIKVRGLRQLTMKITLKVKTLKENCLFREHKSYSNDLKKLPRSNTDIIFLARMVEFSKTPVYQPKFP